MRPGESKLEVDRCLGDISCWVTADVKSVVIDAAARAVLELEAESGHPERDTQHLHPADSVTGLDPRGQSSPPTL